MLFRSGGCPAASHFLCFAKESNQRKATPGERGARLRRTPSPALLARRGGCGTRVANFAFACSWVLPQPSDSPRRLPRAGLRYSALWTGIPALRAGWRGASLNVVRRCIHVAGRETRYSWRVLMRRRDATQAQARPIAPLPRAVIPAQAGIQVRSRNVLQRMCDHSRLVVPAKAAEHARPPVAFDAPIGNCW